LPAPSSSSPRYWFPDKDLVFALIQRSAWKRNSANFAFTEFCEVELRFMGDASLLNNV
jgi:hypothetical protein